MLYWDKTFRKERVSARLKAASAACRVAFAAGCLQHAYDFVRAHGKPQPSRKWRALVEESLKRAKAVAEGDAAPKNVEEYIDRAMEIAPDEDEPGAPGEDNIISGAMGLYEALAQSAADDATGVANYAYQAVMEIALPDLAGGESAVMKAEMNSELCRKELAFQVGYLQALESQATKSFDVADIIAELDVS